MGETATFDLPEVISVDQAKILKTAMHLSGIELCRGDVAGLNIFLGRVIDGEDNEVTLPEKHVPGITDCARLVLMSELDYARGQVTSGLVGDLMARSRSGFGFQNTLEALGPFIDRKHN